MLTCRARRCNAPWGVDMRKQGLLLGTALLLCSNIFVKGLGFFYRVMLVRLLGAEGIGLVEMVSPLFSFLLVIAGLGLQLALSQSTASGRFAPAGEFRTAKILLTLSGGLVCLLSFQLAPFLIRHFVPDQRIYQCFVAVLPAIFIISLASAYRGYFQGQRQVSALGMSQSVEQIVRIACGLWLVSRLAGLGIEKAAAGASLATVCGEAAGFCYLILRLKAGREPLKAPFSFKTAGRLLRFGLPVTLGRLATSAIMMLQAFLIPLCLQKAGWDMRAATEMYGRFSGVAMSMIHLPGVFTSALAVAVMPAVAEEAGGGNLLKSRVGNSLRAAGVFTFPGMLLLFCFADQLCGIIFHSPLAAPLVRLLALGGCFFHLQITLASILQGLGEVRALLINNILAGLILLAGIVLLVPRPTLGISGAALAADVAWVSGFTLNLLHFLRVSRLKFDWVNVLAKPTFAALIAGGVYLLTRGFIANLPLSDTWRMLCGMLATAAAYFVVLLLVKGLSIGLWSRIKRK